MLKSYGCIAKSPENLLKDRCQKLYRLDRIFIAKPRFSPENLLKDRCQKLYCLDGILLLPGWKSNLAPSDMCTGSSGLQTAISQLTQRAKTCVLMSHNNLCSNFAQNM